MTQSKEVLIIVPTRERPENLKNFYESFVQNSTISDLCVVIDEDQRNLYTYLEGAVFEYLPRQPLVKKLNTIASKYSTRYKYICFAGDDVLIRTPGWDEILTEPLKNKPGVSYGNDLFQGKSLPNVPVISSELIRATGFFAPWELDHYYMDDYIKKVGEDLKSIHYFDDVITEHMHPGNNKAESDELYDNTYWSFYEKDSKAWEEYLRNEHDKTISKIQNYISKKRNAIVYSFYVRESKLSDNLCYRQLLYSLTTLRNYNEEIPVKVYIAPSKLDKEENDLLDFNNLEIIEFDSGYPDNLYKSWLDWGYAEFLYHRWQNAFNALGHFEYDNILYLDTDTIFYNDPEILFRNYGNTDFVWAREDNSMEVMKTLQLVNAMNDGQFILSKNILPHKEAFEKHSIEYINRTLTEGEKLFDEPGHRNIHWLMVQYAAYDYFKSIDKPVQYFDRYQVMLHVEPENMDTSKLVLQHYYNGNTRRYVPKNFLNNPE